MESGWIEKKDHQYVLSSKPADIQIPDTIQGIIAARIDRLDDSLKRTMQVASVIGREFAFPILEAISAMKEDLKSHLLSLQGLEFIYKKRLFPELEYIFKHALTQEVAYNSLLLKRRKEIHEKIGKAIEVLYPDRLEDFYEIIAHHYSMNENPEKAYQYLILSGTKATKNYSNWEAFHFYKKAIDILAIIPENETNKRKQIEVILLMAVPMGRLAYPEDSFEILQKGEMLSKELNDEKSHAQLLGLIGIYHTLRAGDSLLGIRYSEDSFQEAENLQDIDLMAPIGMDLCISYHFVGEYFKLTDVASKVIALLERNKKQSESFGRPYNAYSILFSYYALSMDMLGSFDQGSILFEKGLAYALEVKNLDSLSLLELNHGLAQNVKGNGQTGIEHLQNCIRYCEEGHVIVYLGLAWTGIGWGHYLLGNLEAGRQHMEKGLQIQSDAGIPFLMSLHYLLLSMVYFDSGDLKKAQNYIQEALTFSKKNNEAWAEGLGLIFSGRILGKAEKTQFRVAEEYILQGIKILKERRMKPFYSQGYLILAELYVAMGQKIKALLYLKKAQMMFKRMGMDYWLAVTKNLS